MFVDASAMVAILTDEADKDWLLVALNQQNRLLTSAVALWETSVRLMRKTSLSLDEAQDKIAAFLGLTGIEIVSIGRIESSLAAEAFASYGKGRHPAALNMGDCFAYACAKAQAVPLLFIGNDFSQTDINDGFESFTPH